MSSLAMVDTESQQFYSLLEHYELTEKESNREMSNRNLNAISNSCCRRWRDLLAHLELPDILIEDLERNYAKEEERRYNFFSKWKEREGSGASYKRLVMALLDINCRDDAEKVLKILKDQHEVR